MRRGRRSAAANRKARAKSSRLAAVKTGTADMAGNCPTSWSMCRRSSEAGTISRTSMLSTSRVALRAARRCKGLNPSRRWPLAIRQACSITRSVASLLTAAISPIDCSFQSGAGGSAGVAVGMVGNIVRSRSSR